MGSQTRLPGAEGDDAANRIVRRDADGDSISGNYLDAEAAHPAAQLREHFVARIALHSIQPTRMDRHHRPLHIYQIVFAQQLILSPIRSNQCAMRRRKAQPFDLLAVACGEG
jgi:hypothetical protein